MSSDNTVLHIKKSEKTIKQLYELFGKIDLLGSDNLSILMDKFSFALISDHDHYPQIKEHFEEDSILVEHKGVGMIALKYGQMVSGVPNVFAKVSNELGANGINILEAITKGSNSVFFVKEEDLIQACNVLNNLINRTKKKL